MSLVALNNSYFQDLLRCILNDESITVVSCDESEACEEGSNFMSNVKQILINGSRIVEGTTSHYRTSLIVKQLPENVTYNEKFQVDKAFLNEVIAYNIIMPALNTFASEKLSIPACLTATEKIIVVEDLCINGFSKIEKGIRFSLELSKTVVKELAKLHSASIIMKIQNPEKFEDMTKKLHECVYCRDTTSSLLQTQDINIDIAIKLFESYETNKNNQEALETLMMLKGKTGKLLTELIWMPRKFVAVTHGDVWSNNILFKANEVKLIDFQMMRVTSVAADLTYFFYVNLELETLKKHLDELLQFYLEWLHYYLNSRDVNLKNVLTMEWIKKEMKEFELFGFMCAIWFLPIFHWKKEDLIVNDKNMQNISVDNVFTKMSSEYRLELTNYVLNFISTNKKRF